MKELSARRSAAVLVAVNLFSQGVGFFYRVCLSRAVGSAVMGLYQLTMSAWGVLMSLTAIGFTAACAQLTARRRALGEGPSGAVTGCMRGFLAAFAIVAALTVPLSDLISVLLLGDARTRLGLLLMLPCVLLTGVENIHKHAFYGSGRVTPPALNEICEQLVRTGAVLGLLRLLLPLDGERAVGVIVCGMILCEVFSAISLSLLYRRLLVRSSPPASRLPARQVFSIALPAAGTALLGNVMSAAVTVLIPRQLIRGGQDVQDAMSAFGILCGMTLPLLTFPTLLISSMSPVLLPRMAHAAQLGQTGRCRRLAVKSLTATSWLILPAAALLAVLAPTLGQVLFRESAAGQYAVPLALSVAMGSFETVVCVCLNGLGKQSVTARNDLISTLVRLVITWQRVALPGVGLRGYVEAVVIGGVVGLALNWRSLSRLIHPRPQLFPWLIAPGLAAALAALWSRLLLGVLTRTGMGSGLCVTVCAGMGCVLYLAAMQAQGAGQGALRL